MEKNIKDYLHLYLGHKCKISNEDDHDGWKEEITPGVLLRQIDDDEYKFIQPILRPLSELTKEELREWAIICGSDFNDKELDKAYEGFEKQGLNMFVSKEGEGALFFLLTKFLLSKGIDIFGLIDSGLAINKTTL